MTLPLERICANCRGKMSSKDKEAKPSSPHIWSDRYLEYTCNDCGHTAAITAPSSLIFGFVTGLAGIAALAWGLSSLGSFAYFMGAGLGGAAMGLGLGLLILVLTLGGAVAAWSSVKALQVNLCCPPATPGIAWGPILATFLVSALPVALAVGFGFYDHYVKDLDDYGFLVLPVIFSPLLLGMKLGLSFLGLFLGCAMWMGILIGVIFLF